MLEGEEDGGDFSDLDGGAIAEGEGGVGRILVSSKTVPLEESRSRSTQLPDSVRMETCLVPSEYSLFVGECTKFVFLLGQFNLQRFISSVKSSEEKPAQLSSWLKTFGKHLQQKSLYALGLCSEFQLIPDDTLPFGLDSYDYISKPCGKAVLHHKDSLVSILRMVLMPSP